VASGPGWPSHQPTLDLHRGQRRTGRHHPAEHVIDADADGYTYPNTNPHAESNADGYTYPNTNPHAESNADGYTYPNTDANANTYTDA
jgi:hypothetical protein